MSDELKLKPCPFCGAKPTLMRGATKPMPGCANEDCGLFGRYMTTAEWNRRAPTAELAELREALESIASGITGDMLGTVSMTTEDMKSIARKAIAKGGGG